jgi:hypothetical protein
MKNFTYVIYSLTITLILYAFAYSAQKEISKVYSDKKGSIHIVYKDGMDVKVTNNNKKKFTDPKIAEDKLTIGWLDSFNTDIPELNFQGDTSTELTIYRNGKVVRKIKSNEACIKGWKFVENGKQVAIVDGGLRFGYLYSLYDVATGKIIQFVDNPTEEKIPVWGENIL